MYSPQIDKITFITKLLWVFFIILFQAHAAAPNAGDSGHPENSQEIDLLVLHSKSGTMGWGKRFDHLFQREFVSELSVIHEYLAVDFFKGEQFESDFLTLFRKKYDSNSLYGRPPKHVLCLNLEALEFVVRNAGLFEETPIIYVGRRPKPRVLDELDKLPLAIGLYVYPDIRGNIQVISELHPNRKKILLITWAKARRERMQSWVRPLHLGHEVSVLNMREFTYEEMLETLRRYESQGVVLFHRYRKDKNEVRRSNIDVIKTIGESLDIPIYGTSDTYLDHGIVGCTFFSVQKQVESTANVLKQIIDGVHPSDVSVLPFYDKKMVFDVQQLEQWGLSKSDVPPQAQYINERVSIWVNHKKYVIVSIVIIVSLIVVILFIAQKLVYKNRISKVQKSSEVILGRKNDELEQELERSTMLTRELSRANQIKGSFLSVMTHELRTPLNPILGFSQLLIEETENKEHVENLKEIQNSGRHLLKLIDGILNYCRYESGECSLGKDEVHVRELVDEVLYNHYPAIRAKHLEVRCDHLPCRKTFYSDGQRIKQLVSSLLSNAVKFTDEGSIIIRSEIEQVDVGEYFLKVEVVDSGIGISEDIIDSIFTPFFQADATSVRKHQGIGMGLALARGIVGTMQGELRCHKNEGMGMTFWFKIPVFSHVDISEHDFNPADVLKL